jgi:hypothetical protein
MKESVKLEQEMGKNVDENAQTVKYAFVTFKNMDHADLVLNAYEEA